MQLTIHPKDKVPVSRQIADQIDFAIKTGKLAPGERLPSLRLVAKEHGIAVNTVAAAYHRLEALGLVTARKRSAHFVVDHPGGPLDTHKKAFAPAGRYAARGVSASKAEVHAVVDKLDPGIFPGAFCKITEDYLTGDPDKCNIIHSDGSGTKSILGYLSYRETGDPSVFHGIAQDSIIMNIDDLLCVGAIGRILISSTLNRNARNFPGEALGALINGTEKCLAMLRDHGLDVYSGGGETADVGDLTGTVTVDSCAVAVMSKDEVITGEGIRPGLVIVGVSSAGTCDYEEGENSGIGSNGLTSARHDLLSPHYRDTYPETFDPQTDRKLVYCGPYRLGDPLPGSKLTVGQALLSPTRTYAPLVARLLNESRRKVRGLVHCSGGGQTKCIRFGRGVHFVKDKLMPVPPVFTAIQKASGTSLKEMFQVYNMGHRLEIYCTRGDAPGILRSARAYGLDADVIGHTEKSAHADGRNHVTIHHQGKKLTYG